MLRSRWIVSAMAAGLGLWVLLPGCSKPSQAKSDSVAAASVPDLAQPDMPPLGDYLPPLDDGRLEMAPPKDWAVSPRSAKFVVRFKSDPSAPYPSVVVTAEDCSQFRGVTEKNVQQYLKFVAAEMEAAGRGGTVRPGRIGQMVGVVYQRRVKVKDSLGTILDQLYFDTVLGGRRYRFQLWANSDIIDLAKPAFLSILNGTKFSAVEEMEAESLAGEADARPQKPAQAATGGKPAEPAADQPPKPPAGEVEAKPAAPTPPPAEAKPEAKPQPGTEAQPEPKPAEPKPEPAREEKPTQEQKKEEPKKEQKKEKSVDDVLQDVDSLFK
ncbi:MAG: hypothetical protein ACUVQQ_04740 [Thermogutta sp.]